MVFGNREEAAILLERKLKEYAGKKNSVIVAIPRGGIEIGHYLSKDLKIPLDFLIVKKIHHPANEEVAIGAIGLNFVYVDEEVVNSEGIPADYIDELTKELRSEIKERHERYRKYKTEIKLAGKTVIIVDDGIATGHTIFAAIKAIKKQKPKKIVVAVPVGRPQTLKDLKKKADEVISLMAPENFNAIGQFYADFPQIEDEQAIRLLKSSYSPKK